MTRYSEELGECAFTLCKANQPTQATRRRAASTAYYALFHFLIEEACRNWIRTEQRSALARMFGHQTMVEASRRWVTKCKNAPMGSPEGDLCIVASAFIDLQQSRHVADYDLSTQFSDVDVETCLNSLADAQISWEAIQGEQIAQDYLLSLLFKPRP